MTTDDALRGLLSALDPARISASASVADGQAAGAAIESLRDGDLVELREDGPRHLTVSGLLTAGSPADDGPRFVALGLHAKSGQWRQLGGHLDETDASLRAAALRELREESGVDADGGGETGEALLLPTPVAVREFAVGSRTCAAHVDVLYAAWTPARVPMRTTDPGVTAVDWWPSDALPDTVAEDLRRDLPVLLERVDRQSRTIRLRADRS